MANNILQMNRGDTLQFTFTINDYAEGFDYYRLAGNDALYFGLLLPNQQFEDAIVKKKYTTSDIIEGDPDGAVLITLEPKDTLCLLPGRYYYMIKLKMDHIDKDEETGEETHVQSVTTIINKTKFFIYD